MKVSIPKSEKVRGPQIFCSRLYNAMAKISGVKMVDPSSCSIQLHSVLFRNVNLKAKHVLRLDGVYHHVGPEYNWKERNKPIKKSFDSADGIVYQSHFSKRLCEKYLGRTKVPYAIIHNGADPNTFVLEDSDTSDTLPNRPFFLAVANWRPFKRLVDIIESFLLANFEDVDLIIVGSTSKLGIDERIKEYKKHPNIQFLGRLSQEELIPYYVSCISLIHISWIDNCPNSVVEAICAGKPIICGNLGGTPELVRKSGGIVLDLEVEYDLEPKDMYHPPAIDRSLIVDALQKCFRHSFCIKNSHVNIKNTATEYHRFFKYILGSSRG